MKIYKRRLSLLLTLIFCLAALILPVMAIDAERDVSLTVVYKDGRLPIADAEFNIYLVARADADGRLEFTDSFADCGADLGDNDAGSWRRLASTLKGIVRRDGIAPSDSTVTDGDGLARFPSGDFSLEHGLYLVIGERCVQNGRFYLSSSFMVMLPEYDSESGEWLYAVTADAKHSSDKIPEFPQTITRKVLKVWNDEGSADSRPEEIEVSLLCGGEVYDTVTLSADNNWRYSWSGLDSTLDWTVAEEKLDGYTVEVSLEGITFVITNTRTEPEKPPETTSPDTETVPPPDETTPVDTTVDSTAVDSTLPPDETHPSTSGSDVTTAPEPDVASPTEETTGAPSPDEPVLPQTGQLWWPVPLLVAAGLVLVIAGIIAVKVREE